MSRDEKTWQTLEQRWKQGFDLLWLEEQETIALWWLVAEVMNGGLDQYFWNSSGDLALLAQAGLRRLELPITAAALDAALVHFGPHYPVDRDERHKALNQLEEQFDHLFDDESGVIADYAEQCDKVAVEDLRVRYLKAGIA